MATLVQDPVSGMWSSNADPTGTGRSMVELNGGPAPAASTSSGQPDPYTVFNANLAGILTQIQKAAASGRNNLGGARDALTTEAVGAAGGYNPQASPSANVGAQSGIFQGFAPAVTSVNTQLENANAGVSDLGNEINALETAYKPQALAPGQSLVTPAGGTVSQGHSYTPTVNPLTGLVDGFDQNTGTWASNDNTGPGASNSAPGGGAGGSSSFGATGPIDSIFGASNPMGAYATDPNYVKEITGLYGTISGLGVTQSPDTLQGYINNNAKGSPVTGQMIMNAAQTYSIDPALLTTVLLHESDFGTAGAAVKTMNPGNIGNTGTSTRAYGSWQAGVMATAKNLSSRISAAGSGGTPNTTTLATASPQSTAASSPSASATSPVGGSFAPAAQSKVALLPAAMQSYVDAGPLGTAYINDDRVPADLKQSVQTLAARAGIPYVLDSDVGALKSMQTVLDNLDAMQNLANSTLKSGVLGHIEDATLGPVNEKLQTNWGQNLGLFDNYRDTAIKAVQALAGGAGSGLRINMGEIAANTQNLPQATDSIENATKQIQQLKQLIYTQLSTTFPYAPVSVKNPQGQEGQIPASNLDAALKQGYTVI